MPVFDPGSIGGILADLGVSILTYAGIAGILYAIGGILIRTVSWALDKMLISLIEQFYGYFEEILGGTLFTEGVVDGMMNRVYLIIGVFLVFKLGMLLVQYAINPAEVMEEKGGVNSLIRRAITGLCLIIFIPTIFDIANDFQAAILKDQIIEKIIMDDVAFAKVEEQKRKYGTGRVIGMSIYQGFWNIDKSQVTNKNIIRAYEEAEEKKDPAIVEDAGFGILTESNGNYAFNYFPILSTAVLGYVLYLVIKYCIDMVLRLFKLLILQILAPITIVEYIINGDKNEIFQKWKSSVIANYAMLFMRVFTIWFVVYVMYLMDPDIVGNDSLLATQDYLLKTIIVLALLAFMMDFPKMLSDIFGLDLEQDASVKGLMGKAMGVGMAGLAIGGAAVGAGAKVAGGASTALKGGLHNMKKGHGVKGALSDFGKGTKATAKATHLGSAVKGGLMGFGAGVMQSNSLTGSVYKGYAGASNSSKAAVDKVEAKEEKQADKLLDTVKSQAANNPQANKSDIIDSVLDTQVNAKLNGVDVDNLTANIAARLKVTEDVNGQVKPKEVVQSVQQVLGSTLGVDSKTTTQIVNQVLGDSGTATTQQVTQIVNQVVQEAKNDMAPEVTQVVNQVMGSVVSTTASDATQVVNQTEGQRVSTTANAATQVVNQTEGQRASTTASDATQVVNQTEGSVVNTKVSDATQTINRETTGDSGSNDETVKVKVEHEEPESLFDGDTKIVNRTKSGEYETLFDPGSIDG